MRILELVCFCPALWSLLMLGSYYARNCDPSANARTPEHGAVSSKFGQPTLEKDYMLATHIIGDEWTFALEDNADYVSRHNTLYARGNKSFTLALNKFARMHPLALVRMMGLDQNATLNRSPQRPTILLHNGSVPAVLDWRDYGYVTAVKNQGVCYSCWAFSATGSLEALQARATGRLVSLSEQNLLDCSFAAGNRGCYGGLAQYAFDYVIGNRGIDSEATYPYAANSTFQCKFHNGSVAATMSSYAFVTKGDEEQLKIAVATYGPVSVAVDARLPSFAFYKSGIYYDADCRSSLWDLNHELVVVGYGADHSGNDYWLLKNSFGIEWGEQGFMRLARNKDNHCGVATTAMYILP